MSTYYQIGFEGSEVAFVACFPTGEVIDAFGGTVIGNVPAEALPPGFVEELEREGYAESQIDGYKINAEMP